MKKYLAVISLLLMFGCSGGPMHSFYGPIETPKYKDVVKNSILNDGESIKLAAEAASMPEYRTIGGALLATNSRLLFASWDISMLQYSPSFSIPFDKIESYGLSPSFQVPLGLFGKAFYVKTNNTTYYFASDQLDSFFYYIESNNEKAIRTDS